MKVKHIYPKKKNSKNEINKQADCTKCIHAHKIAEHTYECDAEVYDIKTLSCYEPKE